ncbi:hypothetical protein HMPREF0548_1983 [Lactobacillus ultunensis DSM 16047]|uniref:Uncharacterized protein n=1 Tax=Lactobacillus ultunensis DSM 16047 TaxID=525365 RepID=C2EQN7_9LACO|nr:hypothetical protein HMPREF0548_1983 [Lactobacillus ultunensis DSM 16047]
MVNLDLKAFCGTIPAQKTLKKIRLYAKMYAKKIKEYMVKP